MSHTNPTDDEASRTELETFLMDYWREVLRVDEVGLDDNFFTLGGDSLTATSVAVELAERFRIDPAELTTFEHPTVRVLAETIERLVAERTAAAGVEGSAGDASASEPETEAKTGGAEG